MFKDTNNNSEILPLRPCHGEINTRRIRIDSLSPQRAILLKRSKNSSCSKCKNNSWLKVAFGLVLFVACLLFLVLGIIMIANLLSNLPSSRTSANFDSETKSLLEMNCNESMVFCDICQKNMESCQIREVQEDNDLSAEILLLAIDQLCEQCLRYNPECINIHEICKKDEIMQPKSNDHHHFCYKEEHCDPETWIGECKTGRSQSPITLPDPIHIAKRYNYKNSINSSDSNQDQQRTILGFSDDYKQNYSKFYIENNGHTIQIKLQEDYNSNCTIFGETLNHIPYKLAQLHLHWGSEDGNGSEHGISGEFTELEIHFVHYSTKYNSLHQALFSSDSKALAVLGVFVKLNETISSNENLNPILNAVNQISNNNPHEILEYKIKEEEGKSLNLYDLIPELKDFYRYDGSLTTPPCFEKVSWIIFRYPIPISKAQLAILQNVTDHHSRPISNNYRPVQPINNREILFHED